MACSSENEVDLETQIKISTCKQADEVKKVQSCIARIIIHSRIMRTSTFSQLYMWKLDWPTFNFSFSKLSLKPN